jgi:hypothetical protein
MGTINSDEHDAKHGVRSGRDSKPEKSEASEGVRTTFQQYTTVNSEVM